MQEDIYTSLYRRQETGASAPPRTVLCAMDSDLAATIVDDSNLSGATTNGVGRAAANERRMVGVLYSVSRMIKGEIFPVYEGMNNIGSGSNNEIILSEATVSNVHASLSAVYTDFPDEKYEIYIRDNESDNGTYVSEREVLYGEHEVGENDVIRIGDHYQLILKLFEPEKNRLYTDPTLVYTGKAVKTKKQPEPELPPEAIPENSFYSPTEKSKQIQRTVLY